MLPKKFAPALFGLTLSGLMSLLVSGISTYRAVGIGDGYASLWTVYRSTCGGTLVQPVIACGMARRSISCKVCAS
ncbi:MAG: DUF2798 domain-containing protein [Rubrivivax sp.]|nr:DUF2798 domain-containing protein [Rubrivivax sp.]MDP3610262.1 DUF2798 domain-containing protein [Rubrivivax sp.]